jgi:hypothetical protein
LAATTKRPLKIISHNSRKINAAKNYIIFSGCTKPPKVILFLAGTLYF